ncbi:hypothetical protein KSP39_PZI002612 [Platanthera zijinensis]|uniref:NHL repeat-containing protein n=1 Tax=Platanthera zijinensis TaxID=2320716 RepID=A0AAP0GEI8_9ASPA
MPPPVSLLFPLFLLTLTGTLASPELEPGYSVSTVLDFNKPLQSGGRDVFSVRPFAILPLARSPNIVLLDSTHSSLYSLELPLSQDSVIRLLSGNGTAGFSDGDPTSAMFRHPRSFTVDSNDNVYVADRINHVIRKISRGSGMTSTIAGGYPRKAGHTDGPAQNATFSEDFDLLYMPKMCALLISDRGSGMIRQMDLRLEDCEAKPQPSRGLGAISVSLVAFVALLCGLAFGFIARPFVISSSSEASMNHSLNHFRLTRMKPLQTFCSGIKSVVASSEALRLLFRLVSSTASYIRVVLRNVRFEKLVRVKEHVLLLYADFPGSHKMHHSSDEEKDLIDFEGESCSPDPSPLTDLRIKAEDDSGTNVHEEVEDDVNSRIDRMMISNLFDFAPRSKQQHVVRRRNGVQGLSY